MTSQVFCMPIVPFDPSGVTRRSTGFENRTDGSQHTRRSVMEANRIKIWTLPGSESLVGDRMGRVPGPVNVE